MASKDILELLKKALAEDVGGGDITSEACIPPDAYLSAKIVLKQQGRVAGLPFFKEIFQHIDPSIELKLYIAEGTDHAPGTVIGSIAGLARSIFLAERVALNLIQHTSGIATLTSQFVERVEDYSCDILDTRKTLPGLRWVEKYAVRMGGGKNHRSTLDERFIIKKAHLRFIGKSLAKPVKAAVEAARNYRPGISIEVEVPTMQTLEEALDAGADIIMLDHWEDLRQVAKAVKVVNGRAYIEIYGDGVSLDTVHWYAETGVNGISLPALTDSVPGLGVALRNFRIS